MRIDFVITELHVGGAEKCLTEVALAMAAAGEQVRVFSLGSLPRQERALLVERLREAGIVVESLQADSAWRYHHAFRALRTRFQERPPDLVQTFLHHANVLGIHAAVSAGVPLRVAGLRVAQPRMLRSQLERVALRQAERVICVSRAVERFAQTRLGCAAEQTVVIPNGVDIERFSRAETIAWSQLGWPADADVCLFIGRLDPQKGIELLQQQIDRIAPSHSNRKLLLVGDGPQRESLEAWCHRIGSERVRLLGWQADVAPFLRGCRLLVLPSHYEGMPNVVLEAMAASRPVVCSLVEGSEELLAHARHEQGFPPGDSQQMARRIERFLSDPTLCREIGDRNHATVERHYSIAAMTNAYRLCYRELLARRLETC